VATHPEPLPKQRQQQAKRSSLHGSSPVKEDERQAAADGQHGQDGVGPVVGTSSSLNRRMAAKKNSRGEQRRKVDSSDEELLAEVRRKSYSSSSSSSDAEKAGNQVEKEELLEDADMDMFNMNAPRPKQEPIMRRPLTPREKQFLLAQKKRQAAAVAAAKKAQTPEPVHGLMPEEEAQLEAAARKEEERKAQEAQERREKALKAAEERERKKQEEEAKLAMAKQMTVEADERAKANRAVGADGEAPTEDIRRKLKIMDESDEERMHAKKKVAPNSVELTINLDDDPLLPRRGRRQSTSSSSSSSDEDEMRPSLRRSPPRMDEYIIPNRPHESTSHAARSSSPSSAAPVPAARASRMRTGNNTLL